MENGESTIKLLNTIHKNPELSQREIAETIGISVGKTNYAIKAMLQKSLLKRQDF